MSEFPRTVPSPKHDAVEVESVPPRSGCLSTDAALSFARGALPQGEVQALDAHIDACSDCQRLVVEAVRGMNTERRDGSEPGFKTVFQPNSIVGGRYRIRSFIARGGMGEVYEAWDLELDSPVALKTLTPSVSDSPRALRYLKAEVLHTRRIGHPNVCRIYDFGTHLINGTASTVHFLTMEFIAGKSLAKHLRVNGPFAVEHVEGIAKELLSGLGAAHAAGILHRDFKSDNVMLRSTDHGFTPVILDFGLARPIDRESHSSSHGPAGTMVYMAPEQLEGRKLTPASDVYAFGVVCFEMLTGRRPFEDKNGVEVPFERLRSNPEPPSRVNPDVPRAVDAIVLCCLERDPVARYQSAEQVLAAFERLHAASTPNVRRYRIEARRAALLLLPLAGIATYVWTSASGARVRESQSAQTLSSLPASAGPSRTDVQARVPAVPTAETASPEPLVPVPAPPAPAVTAAIPTPAAVSTPAVSTPRKGEPTRGVPRTKSAANVTKSLAGAPHASNTPTPPTAPPVIRGWERIQRGPLADTRELGSAPATSATTRR